MAHTSRHFEAFARRRGLPFLCVRAGDRPRALTVEGELTTLELPRGRLSFPLDKDLRFDPAWVRHVPAILRALRAFRPEIIHITGPSELGILGAMLARRLRVPLAASWHTNLHEYAATRARWLLEWVPQTRRPNAVRWIENAALAITCGFYRRARVLFAPNPELCEMLEARTGRPCHLMRRGVDTELFSPARRTRAPQDRELVLGFVGRLSVEKNIALLAQVQRELSARGLRNFRFRIVGQGKEEGWLREHLPRAEFCGVLRGGELARAYAGMDVFVFPSHTDTFGNVVLEAMASGVPAVVTPFGGPRSLVRHGENGLIADDYEFSTAIATITGNPALHAKMAAAARESAGTASWDVVFDGVFAAYCPVLAASTANPR